MLKKDDNFKNLFGDFPNVDSDSLKLEDIQVRMIPNTPFAQVQLTREWTAHLLQLAIEIRQSPKVQPVQPYHTDEDGVRRKTDTGNVAMVEWTGRKDFIAYCGGKYKELMFGRKNDYWSDSKPNKKMLVNAAWINWHSEGNFLPVHSHREELSMTTYLATPVQLLVDPPKMQEGVSPPEVYTGGWDGVMPNGLVHHYRPYPGTAIIFPGHTPHCVYPFIGQGIRVNINAQMIVEGEDDYDITEAKRVRKELRKDLPIKEKPLDSKMRTLISRIGRDDS